MAIVYWFIVVLFLLIGLAGAFCIYFSDLKLMSIIVVFVTLALCGGVYWYGNNTAKGKRTLKDQNSDFNNGISRTLTIYDFKGQQIKQYSGKFDVETGNKDKVPYIVFDDENNKRHIVYYTTGTIIIDEN